MTSNACMLSVPSPQILQFPRLCEMYALERGIIWSEEYMRFAERRQRAWREEGIFDEQSTQRAEVGHRDV